MQYWNKTNILSLTHSSFPDFIFLMDQINVKKIKVIVTAGNFPMFGISNVKRSILKNMTDVEHMIQDFADLFLHAGNRSVQYVS